LPKKAVTIRPITRVHNNIRFPVIKLLIFQTHKIDKHNHHDESPNHKKIVGCTPQSTATY